MYKLIPFPNNMATNNVRLHRINFQTENKKKKNDFSLFRTPLTLS